MPVNSEKPITSTAITTTVSSSGRGRRDRGGATGRPGPPLSGSSAKKSLMVLLSHGWRVSGVWLEGGVKQL